MPFYVGSSPTKPEEVTSWRCIGSLPDRIFWSLEHQNALRPRQSDEGSAGAAEITSGLGVSDGTTVAGELEDQRSG